MLTTEQEIIEAFNPGKIKKFVIVGRMINGISKGVIADADDFFTAKRYEKILKTSYFDLETLEYKSNIDYISRKYFQNV